MRWLLAFVGMVLLMAWTIAPAQSVQQRTERVKCGSGASLQSAIDAARPGTRLLIFGTCRGHFRVNRSIELVGGGSRATLRGTTGGAMAPILSVGANARVKVKNLKLVGNEGIDFRGGAIDNLGSLVVADTKVARNAAASCGGIRNTGRMAIRRSRIVDNRASNDTGGICNHGALSIRRSTLSRNESEGTGHISSTGKLVIVNSSLTRGLSANNGVSAISARDLVIRRSRVLMNRSIAQGTIRAEELVIDDSAIRDNVGFAGAVSGDAVNIVDSIIKGNRAEEGAAGVDARDLTLRRCIVSRNVTSFDEGGGIVVRGDSVIGKTVIRGNRVDGRGGGVLNRGSLRVHGSSIQRNVATTGGGIANDAGNVRIRNTVFEANEPKDCDGC